MGVGDGENHRESICSDKPRALQEDGRKNKKSCSSFKEKTSKPKSGEEGAP